MLQSRVQEADRTVRTAGFFLLTWPKIAVRSLKNDFFFFLSSQHSLSVLSLTKSIFKSEFKPLIEKTRNARS